MKIKNLSKEKKLAIDFQESALYNTVKPPKLK